MLWFVHAVAQAGLFDDDEARRQIAHLQKESDTRLQQLEIANRKMLDLVNQLTSMQSHIAELKGRMDELTFALQTSQKQQQDLYVDVDNRIKLLEEVKNQVQPPIDNKLFAAVTANIRAGKYKEARFSLQKFIEQSPKSPQLAVAYYWLGMSQAGLKQLTEASVSLRKVFTDYPEDSYAPEAMLALGSVQAAQGNKAVSSQTLHTLIGRYANSTAAQHAKKFLAM